MNNVRLYTAYAGDTMVSLGTFTDEKYLRMDFPAPVYRLVLDRHDAPPPSPEPTYDQWRRAEYPPLADFVDAIYHKEHGDPKPYMDYMDKVDKVKKKFPKPPKA